MGNIVVGVEGEVASGKTSACRELTNLIDNCVFIDGGALYRGIILAISKAGSNLKDLMHNFDALELMKKLNVELRIENKETVIYINNKKIDINEIQTEKNSIGVSSIASKVDNTPIFKFAQKVIDENKKKYNVIVSARDLVDIYPNMDYHIYITASLEERAKRRFKEFNEKISFEEIKETILKRDEMHKKAGFNKTCDKTIKVDITECHSAKESAKKILQEMEKKGWKNI